MNQNNLWKFILVLLILAWSFFQIYPPTGRKLGEVFQEQAIPSRKDAAYTNIITNFTKLKQDNPARTDYAALAEAAGTNDLARYFPNLVEAKEEMNPNKAVMDRLQQLAAGKIKLGIDLQGGTSFLVAADYSKLNTGTNVSGTNVASATAVTDAQKRVMLSEAVEVLRKRVDRLGVSEPVIQPEGEARILIQLPGLSEADKEEARKQIQRVAYLEFRMVNPDSANLVAQGLTAPGYEPLKLKEDGPNGTPIIKTLLVKKKPELTGNSIKVAVPAHDQVGQPEIEFTLTSEGADIFSRVTRENIHQRLAIVLDGVLLSAP